MICVVVVDKSGWSDSYVVVRAESEEQAAKLAGAPWPNANVEIIQVPWDGPSKVVWCHEDCPETLSP